QVYPLGGEARRMDLAASAGRGATQEQEVGAVVARIREQPAPVAAASHDVDRFRRHAVVIGGSRPKVARFLQEAPIFLRLRWPGRTTGARVAAECAALASVAAGIGGVEKIADRDRDQQRPEELSRL